MGLGPQSREVRKNKAARAHVYSGLKGSSGEQAAERDLGEGVALQSGETGCHSPHVTLGPALICPTLSCVARTGTWALSAERGNAAMEGKMFLLASALDHETPLTPCGWF